MKRREISELPSKQIGGKEETQRKESREMGIKKKGGGGGNGQGGVKGETTHKQKRQGLNQPALLRGWFHWKKTRHGK